MGSKIKVGDWVMLSLTGEVGRVIELRPEGTAYINGRLFAAPCSGMTKLPASPADMAKSHTLLLASIAAMDDFTETGANWGRAVRTDAALRRHIAKFTTKQSRRGGKGNAK